MPTKDDDNKPKEDPVANLIRAKIDALYGVEPNAKVEIEEVSAKKTDLSKHQKFMQELMKSGKSTAEIQTEWHKYYQELPDDEKHVVWQEFYSTSKDQKSEKPGIIESHNQAIHEELPDQPEKKRSIAHAKKQITQKARAHNHRKISAKSNFKSLLFGVSMGTLTLFVLMFSFFNERFVAPFITPSKNVSSSSIIIDPNSTSVGPENLVIIPKINVEIPVNYVPTVDDKAVENGLEHGAVHYATTPNPGQKGNTVVVGHSSSNIFNNGKYKFAFVLLNRLSVGDIFSLTKGGKRYVYKVYERKIVEPTEVSVLGATSKPATATLITCDPPGSSARRLVVVGEQIYPSPSSNTASTATASNTQPALVPGNAPSLWSRLLGWFNG